MTAARRLPAILAAAVGLRAHRDGTSENRANGSFPQGAGKTPQGKGGL